MRMNRVLMAAALTGAAISMTACGGTSKSLGFAKSTPDEYRVVAKAPLVLPPDYGLRPPAPGEPRPPELAADSDARQTLLAQRQGLPRSEGERLLVAKAGADRADPLVRNVVDDENGDLAHKTESFTSKVLFWKKDAAAQPAPSDDPTVDANAEAARIKELTGGKAVMIRKQATKFKLPGL